MARFNQSREKRSFSRDRSQGRDGNSGNRSFAESRGRKFSDRGSRGSKFSDRGSRGRGNRRDSQRTRVTCSACGKECEVPFKPTSSKPVYCDECFSKTNDRSGSVSLKNDYSHEFDVINEKLNKIMKVLEID